MNFLKNSALILLLAVVGMTSCKKGPEKMLYKTWEISSFEAAGMDSVAMAAMQQAKKTVEFTKKGEMIFSVDADKTVGTFTTNKEVTELTTTMSGSTSTYRVSGFSETGMTLSADGEKMVLTSSKK
jgi:hypothetical protein